MKADLSVKKGQIAYWDGRINYIQLTLSKLRVLSATMSFNAVRGSVVVESGSSWAFDI